MERRDDRRHQRVHGSAFRLRIRRLVGVLSVWRERYCYAVYRFCKTSQWRHVWYEEPNFELWREMLLSCVFPE